MNLRGLRLNVQCDVTWCVILTQICGNSEKALLNIAGLLDIWFLQSQEHKILAGLFCFFFFWNSTNSCCCEEWQISVWLLCVQEEKSTQEVDASQAATHGSSI